MMKHLKYWNIQNIH